MSRLAMLMLCGGLLCAQELTAYRFDARIRGVPYCGAVEIRGETMVNPKTGILGGVTSDVKAFIVKDLGVVPRVKRQDPGPLHLADSDNRTFDLASLRGKVVVLGYFSIDCQASCVQMAELGDLQPKEDAFQMRLLPVSFQGWGTLQPFLRRNKANLPSPLKIFLPGTGKHGVAGLQGEVDALPLVTILDRDGKIASSWIGHFPGRLVERLKAIIPEKPAVSTPGS